MQGIASKRSAIGIGHEGVGASAAGVAVELRGRGLEHHGGAVEHINAALVITFVEDFEKAVSLGHVQVVHLALSLEGDV